MLADDNAITCFVDDIGVTCWVDDLGQTLCCDGSVAAPKKLPRGQVNHPGGWHFVRGAEK